MIDARFAAGLGLVLLFSAVGHGASVEQLLDANVQNVGANSNPKWLGVTGNRAWFNATAFNQQPRLYRSDGTSASTVAQTTTTAIVDPREGRSINGHVVFLAHREGSPLTLDLWSVDSTDNAPVSLRAFGTGLSELTWLGSNDTRGYFCFGSRDYSCELFVTDGTAAGTLRLFNNRRVNLSPSLVTTGGDFYFTSSAIDGSNFGLWTSDGTVAGTRQLLTLPTPSLEHIEQLLHVEGNVALIEGSDSQGAGIHAVDLTTGVATRLASRLYGVGADSAHLGALHFFVRDANLWRSDGTPAGTFALTTTGSPPYGVRDPLRVVGDRVVFALTDSTLGTELWSSDGTLAGTQILRDIIPGPGGFAEILASTPQRAFFIAGDAAHAATVQFWVTDGTPAGTRVIPQRGGAAYEVPVNTTQRGHVAGNTVYFNIYDTEDVPGGTRGFYHLWSTDLTGTDVVRAGLGGYDAITSGNRLFYVNIDDVAGREPWISDGTVAGTMRVRDIAVSGQNSGSDPDDYTLFGNRAFFSADDGVHGRELWITDGTSAGTRMLKDTFPGFLSGSPSALRVVGGYLYFMINTCPGGACDGAGRLWRSDGTEAGTFQLGEVGAVAGGGRAQGCANWAAQYNGRAWFFGAAPFAQNTGLWSTDGTVDGTREEFALPSEIRLKSLCEMHVSSNGILFIAGGFPESALWRTDGTLAGTYRLGTMRPALGTMGSIDGSITMAGGMAYLLGEDAAGGFEPWRSDGTQAGTSRVDDVVSGTRGAGAYRAAAFGNGIIFAYDSEVDSRDGLYRISGPAAGAARIKEGFISSYYLEPVGTSQLYFAFTQNNTEALWVTDGTAGGSHVVFSASAGSSLPVDNVIAGDGLIYFSCGLGAPGTPWQLCVTNGTAGTPRTISNFTSATTTIPRRMAVLNNRLLFTYSTDTQGAEPWIVRSQSPVAVADTANVTSGSNVLIAVRTNDTDADSAAADLSVSIVTGPAHGTATVEGGSVRYTPGAGYVGADSFEYRLTDEFGSQSAVGQVSVTVAASSGGGSSGGGSSGGGGGGGGGSLDLLLIAGLFELVRRRWRLRPLITEPVARD